ncbi:LOC34620909 [Symbiodinium necroappetens]|uniref:LOC34620909 protein n=1 Tax=Symbiodinium necroappetens TaxID=1628268 RepID=A0A813C9G8_9DINO|nr:LOC34620909 [Symbiodinium necroappetens]
MLSGPVRVQPETKYVAEVVVLVTTLGAKRVEYNAGKRARDLLEIKGVHHKVIDFNRDARQAGTGDAENKAIQKLMEDRRLQTGGNNDLLLPQVFIDGNYVGNASDLQGLEDDGLLENILLRKACMQCGYSRRDPGMTQCPACGASYQEILPGEMTISQALQELAQHEDDFDDEDSQKLRLPPSVSCSPKTQYMLPCARMSCCCPRMLHMQSTCVQSGSVWQDVVIELAQYYEDGEEEFPEAEAPTVASPSSVQLPPSGQEDVVTQTVTKSLTEFPEERRSALGLRPGRRPLLQKSQVPRKRLSSRWILPLRLKLAMSVGSVALETAKFALGEQVQYWSDSKNRWMDAIVEGIRLKEGNVVYDLFSLLQVLHMATNPPFSDSYSEPPARH